jgi:hypothetical protein
LTSAQLFGIIITTMTKRLRLTDDRPRVRSPLSCSILNEDITARFCKLIRKGFPPDAVCDYMSITPTAYYAWLRKGQIFFDGGESEEKYRKYGQFVTEFKKATARYRMRMVNDLHEANEKSWIKFMAILERRDRRTFGRAEPLGGSDEEFNPDDRYL